MHIHKRLKISKSTAKTFLLLLAAAFVAGLVWIGCGDEGNSLAPGGDPSNPDGLAALAPGGGAELATFQVEFDGDVFGGPKSTTHKIKHGTRLVHVPGDGRWSSGKKMPLNLTFFRNGGNGVWQPPDWTPEVLEKCFPPNVEGSEITEGLLHVVKEKGGAHPSGACFWFPGYGTDGEKVTYVLLMSGTFVPEEPWPPLPGGTTEITLNSWEMTTEGKKNKTACTGGGDDFQANVTVTRIE